MTGPSQVTDSSSLSPDAAFGVLGNETRMELLKVLADHNEPIPFSELRDRVGVADSGQFNYHLGQLEGHFVRKRDAGYELRQAGHRVVQAVLSGAVTEAVAMEPTRLDSPCPYCGAAIEVSYLEERLLVRCTACTGSFADAVSTSSAFGTLPKGTLTLNYLPSAGLKGRSPQELLEATLAWNYSQHVLVANGVCSRCSGTIEKAVEVCRDHQTDEEVCGACNTRFAVKHLDECTNCGRRKRGGYSHALLADPRVRRFLEARGLDPVAPDYGDLSPIYDYEEEVRSVDPFEARFTLTVDGDTLHATVDDDLRVVEVTTG